MTCGAVTFLSEYLSPCCIGLLIAQRKDAFVDDVLGGKNGFTHWDIHFTHSIQDWKLESLQSFFALLYSTNIDRNGVDKMVWKPAKNGSF